MLDGGWWVAAAARVDMVEHKLDELAEEVERGGRSGAPEGLHALTHAGENAAALHELPRRVPDQVEHALRDLRAVLNRREAAHHRRPLLLHVAQPPLGQEFDHPVDALQATATPSISVPHTSLDYAIAFNFTNYNSILNSIENR